MPHDQPNPFKKDCSLHHLRVKMLELEFNDTPQVVIGGGSNNDIEKKYLETAYVSLLIGADV